MSSNALRVPFVAGALLLGNVAQAHVTLQSPTPRYPTRSATENKSCPCGVGTSNRICDIPDERSDPNRSRDRATTFAPGAQITVRFSETVGHAGRFRVAFDADGADLDDFNDNILLDVVDPDGSDGNAGGEVWEFEVTLPNIECDNCTLQLIQMMDGNMDDPVPDPVGRSSYYQCADITMELGANGGTGTEDGADVGGETGAEGGADVGTGTVPPSDTGGTTPTPDPETGTGTGAGAAQRSDASEGCSVGGRQPPEGSTLWLALLVFVGAPLRARRSVRGS